MPTIEHAWGWDTEKGEPELWLPGNGKWHKEHQFNLTPSVNAFGNVKGVYFCFPDAKAYVGLNGTSIARLVKTLQGYMRAIESEQKPGTMFPLQHPERKLVVAH